MIISGTNISSKDLKIVLFSSMNLVCTAIGSSLIKYFSGSKLLRNHWQTFSKSGLDFVPSEKFEKMDGAKS